MTASGVIPNIHSVLLPRAMAAAPYQVFGFGAEHQPQTPHEAKAAVEDYDDDGDGGDGDDYDDDDGY